MRIVDKGVSWYGGWRDEGRSEGVQENENDG